MLNFPKSWSELDQMMKDCRQNEQQSVYDHGEAVWNNTRAIIDHLKGLYILPPSWRLPDWLETYKQQILDNLHSEGKIHQYTLYHDCSKPFCRNVDDMGKVHFPDHVQKSVEIWTSLNGNSVVRTLIASDMCIHTFSALEIAQHAEAKWTCEDSVTLVIVALAEIHANAKMFGGVNSTNFKIKWKQVEKRGRQLMKHWFG